MLFQKEMERPFVSAVIPAAGMAKRMNGLDKQFEEVVEVPVLARTMQALSVSDWIDELVVVVRGEDIPDVLSLIGAYGIEKVHSVVAGGQTRQQSVANGVGAVSPQAAFVAIHDGARPLVSQQVIADAVLSALQYGAAAAAMPVVDTIKVANEARMIVGTPARSTLFAVQTPQVFNLERYREAAAAAARRGQDYTDDCQMLEAVGQEVFLSRGDYTNIKITTPIDLLTARAVVAQREGLLL